MVGGRFRMLVVAVVVIAAAATAFALVDGRHNDIRRNAFAGRAPMPNPGGSSRRAATIKPASARQIGRQTTAGSQVDVWAATGHGSNTLRSLYRNVLVLDVNAGDGTVTLVAQRPQA